MLTDPLTNFCAVFSQVDRVFRQAMARRGGLKGFFFGARPYTEPFLVVPKPTFIKLPYTMTPFPLLLFISQTAFQIFFFAPNSTTFG